MVDRHTWMRLSLAQQLGHIGSELSRARHWEAQQDQANRDRALARALNLLDLTLDDKRFRSRLKEPARLREVVGDWFSGRHDYDILPEALEAYCTAFALIPNFFTPI